jgi:hypothetical protein
VAGLNALLLKLKLAALKYIHHLAFISLHYFQNDQLSSSLGFKVGIT